MVAFFKTWCEQIIIAVMISVIIEMFVPSGNIKKYVRVVIGIYIIFVVLNPIVGKLDGVNIEDFFDEFEYSNYVSDNNIEDLSSVYEVAIESQIKEEFEYIESANVTFTDDLEEIERIEIIVSEEFAGSASEIKDYLTENYSVTEDKISIM